MKLLEEPITRTEQVQVLREIKDLRDYLDQGFLPRDSKAVERLNKIAYKYKLKPIFYGCGGCIITNAKAIVYALENAPLKGDSIEAKAQRAGQEVVKTRSKKRMGDAK